MCADIIQAEVQLMSHIHILCMSSTCVINSCLVQLLPCALITGLSDIIHIYYFSLVYTGPAAIGYIIIQHLPLSY